jgi:hypothetical protein
MENLEKKTRDELRVIAKELDIKGRGHMTKEQLVQAIASATGGEAAETSDDVSSGSNKMKYVENAEIGTIVAFKLPDGRVKSAKVERRSTSRRKLKLVTQYGAEFVVPYEDIIWVRTTKRWPKGVYNLLKGKVAENESGSKEEA